MKCKQNNDLKFAKLLFQAVQIFEYVIYYLVIIVIYRILISISIFKFILFQGLYALRKPGSQGNLRRKIFVVKSQEKPLGNVQNLGKQSITMGNASNHCYSHAS